MKYTISIDQVHALEWGLSFSEAAVFSFCNELSTWAEPIVIGEQVWYFASRNKVTEELPWITDKPDTVYRAYKALNEKGVIRWQKQGQKDCIQLTEKGRMWNSEKNPPQAVELGKKSELARKKIRVSSEKNPTDKYTIDKYTIDKRERATAEKETGPTVSQDYFAPDKHETTAAHIIEFLSDPANGRYLNSMSAGDWRRAVKGHCLKLQKTEKWFDLQVPANEDEHYRWMSKRIAGIRSWYETAAEIDRQSGRASTTPAAIPAPPPNIAADSKQLQRASADFARKIAGR